MSKQFPFTLISLIELQFQTKTKIKLGDVRFLNISFLNEFLYIKIVSRKDKDYVFLTPNS